MAWATPENTGKAGVLFRNYMAGMDRAVGICRPYVARIFGEYVKPARVKPRGNSHFNFLIFTPWLRMSFTHNSLRSMP